MDVLPLVAVSPWGSWHKEQHDCFSNISRGLWFHLYKLSL
jgi:hypothetical protein